MQVGQCLNVQAGLGLSLVIESKQIFSRFDRYEPYHVKKLFLHVVTYAVTAQLVKMFSLYG